jgi:hypothetical protein
MLLSRFISDIKKRDWGSIVVELVIVVVGVFFGIQAANWNADRLDQEQGRLITERLLVDLRKDLVARRTLVTYYQAVFDSAERTVTRLNADSVQDPLAFVVDAYRASEYAHQPTTHATYDEIVSTGKLGLIPEAARQAGFVDYYIDDFSEGTRDALEDSPYRYRIRRLLPYDIQVAIRAKCGDLFDEKHEVIGFDTNCDLRISASQLDEAVKVLRSDLDLLRDLRFHISVLNAKTPIFSGEIVILEASIEAMDKAN